MAAVLPPALIQGYALLASGATTTSECIAIPLASLEDLTSAEANATTGDGRKVALALVREILQKYNALAANAKPTKMSIAASVPTGLAGATVRQSYTLNFDLDTSSADVVNE